MRLKKQQHTHTVLVEVNWNLNLQLRHPILLKNCYMYFKLLPRPSYLLFHPFWEKLDVGYCLFPHEWQSAQKLYLEQTLVTWETRNFPPVLLQLFAQRRCSVLENAAFYCIRARVCFYCFEPQSVFSYLFPILVFNFFRLKLFVSLEKEGWKWSLQV